MTYDALVFLLAPALLLEFPALPFANGDACDAWYVYGIYFNLPEFFQWFPHTRQLARLTSALPGYLLTSSFPGVTSDYLLFLLFFTPAVFFLYRTAALMFSRERAALVALFFALSPIVIGNYAATFSGPGITCEVLTLYCVVHAGFPTSPRKRLIWMFLSGVSCGAGMHAHLATVVFSSFCYLLFALLIFLEAETSMRARIVIVATSAIATACGAFAFTAILSVTVANTWGAPYWIVLNQLAAVSDVIANNANIFWRQYWYRESVGVGPCLLGLIAAGMTFVTFGTSLKKRSASPFDRRGFAIAASFLATLAILFCDALSHGIFLEYAYYYVFLWPFLALALFALEIDRGIKAKFPFVILFAVVCFVGIGVKRYDLPAWIRDQQPAASIAVALTAGILLAILQRIPRAALLAGYLVAVASFTLVVRTHDMGGELWERPNTTEQRRSYERIKSGLTFLAQTLRIAEASDAPKFWLDQNGVSDALPYARSYLYCMFKPLPNIEPDHWDAPGEQIEAGDILIIIARSPHLFERSKAVLSRLHLEPMEIANKTIADEKGAYEILIVRAIEK